MEVGHVVTNKVTKRKTNPIHKASGGETRHSGGIPNRHRISCNSQGISSHWSCAVGGLIALIAQTPSVPRLLLLLLQSARLFLGSGAAACV